MEIGCVSCDGMLNPSPPEGLLLFGLFPPDAHDERIAPVIFIGHAFLPFRQDESTTASVWKTTPLPKIANSVPYWCL
jgi:hypothetical protein